MTALPTPLYWLQTLGLLALQVAVLVALATAFERVLKSTPARRAVWQGAMLGLLLLALNAFTGADRVLAKWAKSPPATPKIAVARGNLPPTLDMVADDSVRIPAPPPKPASVVPASTASATWWPLWLWLVGGAVIGARALGSRLCLARFARRGRMACSPEIAERLAALSAGLGLRRPVQLVQSAALKGPIAFGWLRPTIGLPQRFFESHPPAAQDTMLAHELAHLAARDPLWLALADGLCALLWWHPAVWWLRRQFRAASETAADDASLLVQDGPAVLAECLVNLAAQLQTRRATGWLGMAEFRSGLGRRVERLLRLRPEEARRLGQKARWVAPALVAFVLLGLAAAAWAFPSSRSEGPTLFALVQEAMKESAAETPPNKTSASTGSSTAAQSDLPPAPGSSSQTNRTQTTPGRQRLQAALKRIQLEEVGFDNTPLGEVLDTLFEQAKRLDPQNEGRIAVLTNLEMPPAANRPGREFLPAGVGTNSTLPVLNQVRVTVRPPLKQASLREVLDAVVKGANWPIEYSAEDFGIAFSAQWPEAGPLQSRTFKLDLQRLTNAFGAGPALPSYSSLPTLEPGLSREFTATGWTQERGRGEFFFLKPPDHGQQYRLLFVRAAPTNLALVEAVIQRLNLAAEPDTGSARPAPANSSTGQEQLAPTEWPMFPPTPAATNSEVGEKLYSRTFKLDWKRLTKTFGEAPDTNPTNSIVWERLRSQLSAAGWTPSQAERETMFMKPPNLAMKRLDGLLFVRTSMANLDLVEGVLQKLYAAAEADAGTATAQSNRVVCAQLVQDARLYYEMGKLDEAEARLKPAVQLDPENRTARHYLGLVQAARAADSSNSGVPLAPGSLSKTNLEAAQEWLRPVNEPGVRQAQAATNRQPETQLFSRTYKVDFHALAENMTDATGQGKTNALSTHEALDWYFRAAGWNRATNETFFLNERSGMLFVRAKKDSLDVVDSVLQLLTATTPQVLVQVKFVEVSQSDSQALGLDWILGNLPGNQPRTNRLPPFLPGSSAAQGIFPGSPVQGAPLSELRGDQLDWAGRDATNAQNIRVSAALGANLTGILTDPQFRVVMKALAQRQGVDVLSTPTVTTLSGRQAQIRVGDLKTVVTGMQSAGGTNVPITATVACGPVLDVVPNVLADGVTIQVRLKASVTEFLGYDPAPPGATATPQPRFRERQLDTTANVWDGQTLVLGGPIVEAAGSGTNSAAGSARKQLLVFVTPTIIDPAGNRVHTDDEMPFSTNGVPPQPKRAK